MQTLTIANIGAAATQASQVEDNLRLLSGSGSLLGPVQDRCFGLFDVKCQSYNSNDLYYCSSDSFTSDSCVDPSRRMYWRELCDTQRANIGEDGWLYMYNQN